MRASHFQIHEYGGSNAWPSLRADAFGNLRTEGSADTSPPALTTTRRYAQWLTRA